jgi:hypothetical protein
MPEPDTEELKKPSIAGRLKTRSRIFSRPAIEGFFSRRRRQSIGQQIPPVQRPLE